LAIGHAWQFSRSCSTSSRAVRESGGRPTPRSRPMCATSQRRCRRRGRDSNPREASTAPTRLAGGRTRPLCDPPKPGNTGPEYIVFGMPEMRFVRTATLLAAYEESGPPEGPPVILLHGFPYDPRSYDEVVSPPALAGCRLLVPYL